MLSMKVQEASGAIPWGWGGGEKQIIGATTNTILSILTLTF